MSLNLDPRQRAMLAELGVRVWWPAGTDAQAATAVASELPKNTMNSRAASASSTGAASQKDQKFSDPDPNRAKGPASAAEPVLSDNRAASERPPTRSDSLRPAPDAARQPSPARAGLLPGPVSLRALPDGIASMDWPALAAAVAGCQACHMCLGRQQAVFVPPPAGLRCDWLVLGEPPDDAQERVGQPFVDEAGKLLDNMLKAVGVRRCTASVALPAASAAEAPASGAMATPAQVAYLSHVLKCRPARPAAPQSAALAACTAYLQREIALLQPRVILAMGRFAMHLLLSQDHPGGLTLPLGKLRGRVWHYQGVPVVVTYPPAYLLRRGQDKARAWADLCLALDVVQGVAQPL